MRSDVEKVTPYAEGEAKHVQVRRMFDAIAPRYDLLNRLMTLGIDRSWRSLTVRTVKTTRPDAVLDLATGTGDLAIALAKAMPEARVVGADLSEGMIELGRKKVKEAGLDARISMYVADALALPFADNSFDAITIAFGVRNFERLAAGYAEMLRVLRPGGLLCVLELSVPASPIVRPFYNIYTRGFIPLMGRLISGDDSAYRYLPASIRAVPARQKMTALMSEAGFTNARFRSLTLGVCTLYTAQKP